MPRKKVSNRKNKNHIDQHYEKLESSKGVISLLFFCRNQTMDWKQKNLLTEGGQPSALLHSSFAGCLVRWMNKLFSPWPPVIVFRANDFSGYHMIFPVRFLAQPSIDWIVSPHYYSNSDSKTFLRSLFWRYFQDGDPSAYIYLLLLLLFNKFFKCTKNMLKY